MANRTYISTTTRRSPKPRSDRLRAIGAGSVTSTVISLGGSSGVGTAGADGFSPTISFEVEGSVLTVRVVNKTGIKEYEIDLGESTGVDALREDFEKCCREMTEEVKDLRDTIDELKGMMNVVTFTVVPTPADAKVTINGDERASVSVFAGAEVEWRVEADGYITRTGSQTVTEDTTVEVVLADLGSLISSFSYDDIDAGGGSVLPKVEAVEGAAFTYSGAGVDADTGEVSADSLGTTLKGRTRITTVTVTAEVNGSTATATCDVYQQANEVVRHEATGTTYGKPAITGGHTYDDIGAGGGTVTPTEPAYNQTKTTGYTDTYTSGATAPGEYEDEIIRSGAAITYSGTGVNTSTGAVTASSLGTTEKARTKVSTSTVTVTMNGQSASKETDVYQAENKVESESSETTYGTPSVSLSYAKDIPAGGGSVSPTLSYSQTKTTGHSYTYSSGAVDSPEGTTETITSGAEVTYSGTGVNTSTGAVSADSLETRVKERSVVTRATVTVSMNGKSASASEDVYQEANEIVGTSGEDVYTDPVITRGFTYDDIAAGGGTVTPTALSYKQTHTMVSTTTYTSGAKLTYSGEETLTSGAEVTYSGEGVDEATGAVSAGSLGTTVKERSVVTRATVTVTMNGKSGSMSADVYQEANEITDTRTAVAYTDPVITGGFGYDDIPAGGGAVTPSEVTYEQTETVTTTTTYTSGESVFSGYPATLVGGGTVTYSGEGVDEATGAVSAGSLETTVKERSVVTRATVTVSMNGRSASASADVYQGENRLETTEESVTYGAVEVGIFSYEDVPAAGGTVYPDVSYRQMSYDTVKNTYTSGGTETSSTNRGFITDGAKVSYSGTGVNTSTGAVTADSLGTSQEDRTSLGIVYLNVSLNGSEASAQCEVFQEENRIVDTVTRIMDESLSFGTFEYAEDIPAEGGTVYPTVEVLYSYVYRNGYVYTSGAVDWDTDSERSTPVTPDSVLYSAGKLSVSYTIDVATGAVTATAAASTERQRLAEITASAQYDSPNTGETLSVSKTAEVWQEGRDAYLTVSPSSVTVALGGGTATVVVDSSSAWTAEVSDSWLSVSPSSGPSGATTVTIGADIYKSPDGSRSGTVTFRNSDGLTREVTVVQGTASSGTSRTLTVNYGFNVVTTMSQITKLELTAGGSTFILSNTGTSGAFTAEFDDGTVVDWRLYATVLNVEYSEEGTVTMDSDKTINVTLG